MLGLVHPCAIIASDVASRWKRPRRSTCTPGGLGRAPSRGTVGRGDAGLCNWILRILESIYWFGTFTGSVIMLVCGGFVPVGRRWLLNEISGWAGVVETLGGVWFPVVTHDPDSDLGPVVARVDAPALVHDDRLGRPATGR